MDLLNSLFVSVFGMSVVFLALVLLIVMINVLSFAVGRMNARRESFSAPAPIAVSHDETAPPGAAQPTLQESPVRMLAEPLTLSLTGVDEKTAAMIMAIVCDESGIPLNELYFKSIRALN